MAQLHDHKKRMFVTKNYPSQTQTQAPSKAGLLRGEVSIGFTCNPDDRAALVEAALEVVAGLQAEGPTAEEVETVRCVVLSILSVLSVLGVLQDAGAGWSGSQPRRGDASCQKRMQACLRHNPTQLNTLRTLERLEWESAQEENAWWHEHVVAGLQGRTFAEQRDIDAVFKRMQDAHETVRCGWERAHGPAWGACRHCMRSHRGMQLHPTAHR